MVAQVFASAEDSWEPTHMGGAVIPPTIALAAPAV
jgi:hypothetical protein